VHLLTFRTFEKTTKPGIVVEGRGVAWLDPAKASARGHNTSRHHDSWDQACFGIVVEAWGCPADRVIRASPISRSSWANRATPSLPPATEGAVEATVPSSPPHAVVPGKAAHGMALGVHLTPVAAPTRWWPIRQSSAKYAAGIWADAAVVSSDGREMFDHPEIALRVTQHVPECWHCVCGCQTISCLSALREDMVRQDSAGLRLHLEGYVRLLGGT